MYRLIDPKQNGWFDFCHRYSWVAQAAWFQVNPRPFQWRLEFYASLLSVPEYSRSSFRLIEYYDEREDTLTDCGIIGILPLKPEFAEAHLAGLMSQYRAQGKHLHIPRSPKAKSYHYIQSVFLHPSHVRSVTALKLVRQAIWEMLKLQGAGLRERPYFVYTEPQLPAGRRLALNQGLRDLGIKSSEGADLFGYDSTVHCDQAVEQRIRALRQRVPAGAA